MRNVELLPSILSADFTKLGEQLEILANSGVKSIHFDVMDGHFVPNISFGAPVLKCISHKYGMLKDVHLMITDPIKYVKDFAEAGADIITFHYEAVKDHDERVKLIKEIRSLGCKVGVSIKPATSVYELTDILAGVDVVLVMSVEPGFGGQKFMPDSLEKIAILRGIREKEQLDYKIEVDGGINAANIKEVIKVGADMLVAGSYVFKDLSRVKEILEEVEKYDA